MQEYRIDLNARERQPLARCLSFGQGDSASSRLVIRFWDGAIPLGLGAGDYATLSVYLPGSEESGIFALEKAEGGAFALVLGAPLLASPGIARCAASLYGADGSRLTVGRFTYAVEEDPSLPGDQAQAIEQIGLLQQALAAAALMRDELDNLSGELSSAVEYAQAMGDYAKEWGDSAQNAAGGVATTWENLPGRPAEFPPAPHGHMEFSSISGQFEALSDALRGLLLPAEAPQAGASLLEQLDALGAEAPASGYFALGAAPDAPEAAGLCLFFAPDAQNMSALFLGAASLYIRRKVSGLWAGDWTNYSPKPAISSFGSRSLSLQSASWSGSAAPYTQSLPHGIPGGYAGGCKALVGLGSPLIESQRAAARSAKLYVASLTESNLVIGCEGTKPSTQLPIRLLYWLTPEEGSGTVVDALFL
ncbi:MAG: phage baseplate upper protein [Christensenellaceae bacterium]|nr:phage baseplate upper protein [Christensenellaceae bacterium]